MHVLIRCLSVLTFITAFAPGLQAQLAADMDVQGDEVSFEGDQNEVMVKGNAMIRKGDQKLEADQVTYNTATEVAVAKGNVVFTNGDQVWRGETLTYNFITGEGSFPDLEMKVGPFTIRAASAERRNPIQTTLENVVITTCPDPEDPEFSIHAGRVDVYEGDIVNLRNAVFKLRGVPVFYLPRFTLDREREPTNIDVVPGFSSRDGAMLLTGVNRYPSDGYRTKTLLDYRSERGPAIGQNFYWYDPVENSDLTWFKSYFMLDDSPYEDAEEETQLRNQGVDIDEERYRLKFFHRNDLGPNDTLWAQGSYLSDPRVVQDFFEDDFKDEPVPETRASYSAVGDGWSTTVDINRQLNDDMFDSVNRLPEATVLIPRRKLGDSNFLYGSESRAGFLEQTFADIPNTVGGDGTTQLFEDYETTRLHTEHALYYPTRQLGWLNLVPRVGFAATHYSETVEERTEVVPTSTVDENNIIITTLQTNTLQEAQSGDVRFLPELGLEGSFKAFGIVHEEPTTLGKGLRHVVEPFANYTFIPEPDLTPDRIYQFDEIDERGEQHTLAFGVRNKWQTKRKLDNGRNQIIDMVNLGVRTEYDLRSEADSSLGDAIFDLELQLVDWAWARMDARYDIEDASIETTDLELWFRPPDNDDYLAINQRYRADQRHTLNFSYALNPEAPFGWKGSTRYELEEDGIEEQSLMFTIRTDCVGYAFGGKWIKGDEYADGTTIDDEYEVWFQIWLTAFPRAVLGSGER